MPQLAIRGHATRGSEVIELLEMLGGKNIYKLDGKKDLWYILSNSTIEYATYLFQERGYTLEEFLEKFPYKVGDKVILDKSPCIITGMNWYCEDVIYYVKGADFSKDVCSTDKDLQPYIEETIEETMEEKDEKTVKHVFNANVISFDIAQKDKYELDLQGKFKVVLREGKYYVERIKLRYPKTYMECCKMLGISRDDVEIDLPHPYQQKMFNLFKLHICRDAYWKVYGEQMGLGNPWEPDWTNTNSNKYCIYYVGDEIKKQPMLEVHHFLAFPTTEMCNEFYVNFKDLIEQCEEL